MAFPPPAPPSFRFQENFWSWNRYWIQRPWDIEYRDPGQLQGPTDHKQPGVCHPRSQSTGLDQTACQDLCQPSAFYTPFTMTGGGRELVEDWLGGQVAGAAEPLAEFSIQDICRLVLLFSFLSRGAERSPTGWNSFLWNIASWLHCFISDGFCLPLPSPFRPPSHRHRRASPSWWGHLAFVAALQSWRSGVFLGFN